MYSFLKSYKFKTGVEYCGKYTVNRLRSISFFGKFVIIDLFSIYRLLRNDFEIVHIFGISNINTFIVLSILLFIKKDKRPIVFLNDHNHPSEHKRGVFAHIYYLLFRILLMIYKPMIRCIFVPNMASKGYIVSRYKLKDDSLIKIIPLGYDYSVYNYSQEKKNKDNALIVGFAGKIIKEKRIERLLYAAQAFKANPIRFIIVGLNNGALSHYQHDLIALSKQLHLDNVEFREFISNEQDLANFYNYIDLAVFPGSISITTIEASGCGTPVIVFKSSSGVVGN